MIAHIHQIFKRIPEVAKLTDEAFSHSLWLFNATKMRMEWVSAEFFLDLNGIEYPKEKIPATWQKSTNEHQYKQFTNEIEVCLKQSKHACNFRTIIDHKMSGSSRAFIYQARYKSRPYGANKEVYILGFYMDISAPEELYTQLANGQNIQRHFFQKSDHAYYLLDENGTFLNIHGREPHPLDFVSYQAAVGKNIAEVFSKNLIKQLKDSIFFLQNSDENQTTFQYSLQMVNTNRVFEATLYQISPHQYLAKATEKTEALLKLSLMERRNRLQKELLGICRSMLVNMENYHQNVEQVMKLVGEAVDCDRVHIFKNDQVRQSTTNIYEWCAEGIGSLINQRQNVPLSLLDERWLADLLSGEVQTILNVNELPQDYKAKDMLQAEGIKSLLTVPVGTGDEFQGFMGFEWVTHYFIPFEEQINLLQIFAEVFYASFKQSEIWAELALRDKFSTDLLQEIKVPYLQLQRNGAIIECNQALCEMLKIPKHEIIGQTPPYSWWPADEIPHIFGIFDRVINKSEYEVQVNFVDGTFRKFPVLIHGKILAIGDNQLWYASFTDLSQRIMLENNLAETQNWLHIAQQAAGLAHFVLNLQTLQLETSSGLKKLIGIHSSYQPTLDELRELIPINKRASIQKQFTNIIKNRLPVQIKVEIIRPDNHRKKFLNVQGVINYSRTGDALELQGIIRDVSNEVKHLEEIEIQNRRLREIAWFHSHELRTPVVRIMSVLENIEATRLSEQNQKAFQLLKETVGEMDELILHLVRKAESFGLEELEPNKISEDINWEIMLVDDDLLITELAESTIKQLLSGKEVVHFTTGASFIDHLRNQISPNNQSTNFLVFLDINMPLMNGWQVLEHISDEGLGDFLKVAMFTSSISAIDKKRALKFPFVVDFIEKPVRAQNITDLIKRLNIQ